MKCIHFHNTAKVIETIKGIYRSKEIQNEPIFHAIEINKIETKVKGKILRPFLNRIEPLFESDKAIVLYMWKNFLLKNQTMIKPNWHFDDPYFPNDYPIYHDDFPLYKQFLHIVSDNKDGTLRAPYLPDVLVPLQGTSNTEFCIDDITIDNLPNKVTWVNIDERLKTLSLNTFKCNDGDIVEYDSKTLHRATKSTNSGWRLLMKIVFYDKKVYEKVKKINFYSEYYNYKHKY